MPNMYHEHRGVAYQLGQGGDTVVEGIWYERWLCPDRDHPVLIRKPETEQGTIFASGDIVSAYGFRVGQEVFEKKTQRRARIEKFTPVFGWRNVQGYNQRVRLEGEYQITYRWIEPAPGRTRMSNDSFLTDRVKFLKRFAG